MAYIFLTTFIIHAFVDYIYIYHFLDNNFFYSSSGSKIKAMSRDGPRNIKYGDIINNIKSKQTLQVIALVFILFILNKLIFLKLLNSNFIPICIFGKAIDIISFFEGKFNSFLKTYYLLYVVFLFIICPKVLILVKRFFPKKENQIESENVGDSIVLGFDEEENKLSIATESLYQNMLITGSIGSGKTTGVICNVCESLINKGYGGLILDIKGNFVDTVENICKKQGRQGDLKQISLESKYTFNLLPKSLSNLELSFMIKQVVTLISPSNNTDSYWLDKVQNVILNLLIIIAYCNKENRDLYEVHKLVVNEDYLNEKIMFCSEELIKGNDNEKVVFEMQGAIAFIKNEYLMLDTRVKSIIKSEITRLTIPLVTEYEIYNKFCKLNSSYNVIDFGNKKDIVVLSIDVGKNKMLAQIIATFLKLQFQSKTLQYIGGGESVFFIADEYQEFVNIEDARFLSLSREYKCMNIISTQSYSSIRNTLKDDMAANVIIQNLVNKVWLRNDDNYTIQEIIKQLGKINVKKETTQISEGATESKKYIFRKGFKNRKSNVSKSISQVTNKENEYDENFFSRQLRAFEALAFVSSKQKGILVKKIKLERWRANEKEQSD